MKALKGTNGSKLLQIYTYFRNIPSLSFRKKYSAKKGRVLFMVSSVNLFI